MRSSRRAPCGEAVSGSCSTPCGVIAFITRTDSRGRPVPIGAQRLAASLRSSHDHDLDGRGLRFGAQRLAASLRSSPAQDCVGGKCRVCSTPCGVIAFITVCLGVGRRRITSAQRLAASLRSSRRLAMFHLLHQRWCSTPCGVIAFITRSSARVPPPPLRAQRLAASLRSSRGHRRRVLPAAQVLNALRRHCVHHDSHEASRKLMSCAQRLAASLRSSHLWWQ